MRFLVLTVAGASLLGFGLCSVTYGIGALVAGGACGSRDGGPPCPDGTAAMVALVVVGSSIGMLGAGLLGVRGRPGEPPRRTGAAMALGQALFWLAVVPAGGIAAAVAALDPDATWPGSEAVAIALGPVLLLALLGALASPARRRGRPKAPAPAAWAAGSTSPAAVAGAMGLEPPPPLPFAGGPPVPLNDFRGDGQRGG